MKKLLIVDDQEEYLDSLEIYLRKKFEVFKAKSYKQAIETLKTNVDLALIDIRLDEGDNNNIDGLKLLEWINLNNPEIISFVMSAYREFSYAEESLNLGAKHFFKKPIDIQSLLAIILEKSK